MKRMVDLEYLTTTNVILIFIINCQINQYWTALDLRK